MKPSSPEKPFKEANSEVELLEDDFHFSNDDLEDKLPEGHECRVSIESTSFKHTYSLHEAKSRVAKPNFEVRADKTKAGRRRKIIIISCVLVLIVLFGALLGVVLSNGSSSSTEQQVKPPPIGSNTPPPTFPCNAQLDPLSSALPSSFLVRATLADLCTNYPELDCFGVGPSSSSSLMGATLSQGSWYFEDDVAVRLKTDSNHVYIRLEVRHAHDPMRKNRAFVYTVVARKGDMCFDSFYFYEVNSFQSGRFRCSSSVQEARNHSELVAHFLRRPTSFVQRRDNVWVIDSPRSRQSVRTFDATPDFLLGAKVLSFVPSYIVRPARNFPLNSLLDADSTVFELKGCVENEHWMAQASPLLEPRHAQSILEFDSGMDINEDLTVICSDECASEESTTLSAISTCVENCLLLAEASTDDRRRLVASRKGRFTPRRLQDDEENDGDYLEFEFSATIGQDLLSKKLSKPVDQDERLRQCLVSDSSNNGSNARPNVARLLGTLEDLNADLIKVDNNLGNVEAMLVESYNVLMFKIADAKAYLDQLNQLHIRVMTVLQTIRMFSKRDSTIEAATFLIESFQEDLSPMLESWRDYFAATALADDPVLQENLASARRNLHQARADIVAAEVILNRYVTPMLQAKSHTIELNNDAWAAVAPFQRAADVFNTVNLNTFELVGVLENLNSEPTVESLQEFIESVTEWIDYLISAAQQLDAAMNSQVNSVFLVTTPEQSVVEADDACQAQINGCGVGKCRMVTSNLAQTFDTALTSISVSQCLNNNANNFTCTLASSTELNGCRSQVLVPKVTRQIRTLSTRAALTSLMENDETVEDIVEQAVTAWGEMPVLTDRVPSLATLNMTLLYEKIAVHYGSSESLLPANDILKCFSANFDKTTMLCPPLDDLLATLSQFCNLAGGSTCDIDSNCFSGRCLNNVCCAEQACNGVCVAPNGECRTILPTRPPTHEPTRKPTPPTKSPTSQSPSSVPTSSPSLTPTISTRSPTGTPINPNAPQSSAPTSSPVKPTKAPNSAPTKKVRTKRPTKVPTSKPTKKPTKSPTTSPTKAPTFPRPTTSPIVTDPPTHNPSHSPTQRPTNLPTRSPTKLPTLAPVAALCQRPPNSCESIKNKGECDRWTGCLWNSEVEICWTQDCSEFSCRIRQQAFKVSAVLLPGCRIGDAVVCDRQRLQAFNGLKLGTECAAQFIPVKEGGSWMGRDQYLPTYAPASNDIFVSGTGADTWSGTRSFPFRTIERALNETRKDTPRFRRIIILLPGATHRLVNTIRLGPADSGLMIQGETQANTNARPRVTGSIDLSGANWTDYGDGIIKTKLLDSQVEHLDILSALILDDFPAIRARHPNLDDPLGFNYNPGRTVSAWGKPKKSPSLTRRIHRVIVPADDPNVKYLGASISYNRFSAGYGGACSHFEPPVSFFCEPAHQAQGGCAYSLPTQVTFTKSPFPAKKWAKPHTAFFHTLHWYGWGLWTFQVRSQTPTQIVFEKGGWQEARGDCGTGGSGWFAENVIELLDHPNEFFLDLEEKYLYYYPNSDERNPMLNKNLKVELTSSLRRFIEVIGESKSNPVTDVTIRNIEFFGGYATHMDAFEAPSGGDWTIHRGGVVHLEHVESSRVQGNFFKWSGGNSLFLSKHIRYVDVEYNDFWGIGSTAVAVVGDPNWMSDEPWKISDYADNVRIFRNVAAELGLIVKQSAATFVSIGKRVTVEQNVFYDGPRGGIVFNDGFGGGQVVRKNVVFEFVLETNDHGPFDTWDRQQYEEEIRPVNIIDQNMLLGTGAGPKGIDFDDGTYNWISENNVVVWGYQKFKGSYVFARNNLILFPLASSCAFITPQNRVPANWVWENNTCVSYRPPYAYNAGKAEIASLCEWNNFKAIKNTYYYLGGENKFKFCPTNPVAWGEWRNKFSQDMDSEFTRNMPSVDALESWALEKLGWFLAVMH